MPIPGTARLSRLEGNIGAADIELRTDDQRDIDRELAPAPVQGARYPQHLQRMGGRQPPP